MSKIGFKTKEMERQERLPVISNKKHEKTEMSEEEADMLAIALMRQRIRKQAIELIDKFLFNYGLIDYTTNELKKLKELALTVAK